MAFLLSSPPWPGNRAVLGPDAYPATVAERTRRRDFHVLSLNEMMRDTRAAPFYLLALASYVLGLPSPYCLDLASAMAWSAGLLGLAGVIATGLRSLFTTGAGLSCFRLV